jgi:hypothetical protein
MLALQAPRLGLNVFEMLLPCAGGTLGGGVFGAAFGVELADRWARGSVAIRNAGVVAAAVVAGAAVGLLIAVTAVAGLAAVFRWF